MLEDLEWRQRQRIVRAIFRGRPVEDVRDARAAVDACRELRGQWVENRLLRWWVIAGWVTLVVIGLTAVLGTWSVLELLLSVGLPAFALAVATWWTYWGLPRRLERAERANRRLLCEK